MTEIKHHKNYRNKILFILFIWRSIMQGRVIQILLNLRIRFSNFIIGKFRVSKSEENTLWKFRKTIIYDLYIIVKYLKSIKYIVIQNNESKFSFIQMMPFCIPKYISLNCFQIDKDLCRFKIFYMYKDKIFQV